MKYGYGLMVRRNLKKYFTINKFLLIILCLLFSPVILYPVQSSQNIIFHNNSTLNVTDPACIACHKVQENHIPEKSVFINRALTAVSGDNYTAIIAFGQTPYQLGPFFRGGQNGWSWWDVDSFGSEKQKNLIELMILNKSSGKQVTNLASPPAWPQASFRNHSPSYSYKADTAPPPITSQANYPNLADIWMIKRVDLTGYENVNLTFWTWYSMEKDWDYGYVGVSVNGYSWTYLGGTLTTTSNPNGNNLGNGITGNSGGNWTKENMDLSQYGGKKIFLGFRFKSDAATNEEGWYIDDINITSGMTTIFSDDAETPVERKLLVANISYPQLTIINSTDPLTSSATLQYAQGIQHVDLQEDLNHPGTYVGYFIYDPFAEQYSGNYTVALDTMINGSDVGALTQFQTTILGCQSCHNKKDTNNVETSFAHGDGGGMQSCMYLCHGGSRGFFGDTRPFMGPPLSLNPMHVHEMQYGHYGGFIPGLNYSQSAYNIPSHVSQTTCTQCHTSFVHDNTGSETERIGNYTLYGTRINFSSGTHQNLTCEYCHGSLQYPAISQSQYQLQGKLGNYTPTFTSHESFTDTYIIAVNRSENLTITINGENTSNSVELYSIGPIDNTTTALQGPCGGYPCDIRQSLSSPIHMNVTDPYTGTWIIDLIQLQEGTIKYTISSNYPIQKKPIIRIPECNSCHNSSGTGKAFTNDSIPDWNPGFAHVDTNNDSSPDVQCRMCHNSMHNITVKDCHNCHAAAPVNHPIKEPRFSQYSNGQCLECHGVPHEVTSAIGTDCISCHSPSDVNISLFVRHANINVSDGYDIVSNNDCWTCHFMKDMDRNHVYLCESCHINSSGVVNITDPSLIKSDFVHGMTTCKTCHAPTGYHLNGTVGPLGLVERILKTK